MSLPSRFHPSVVTEYEKRVELEPTKCHWPMGPCHNTAQKPKPRFCGKMLGHGGGHMPEDPFERDKRRRAGNQAAYRERQKLKIKGAEAPE